MQGYDVRCPACGHINQHVYLEETDGFMECEKCGLVTKEVWRVAQEIGPLPIHTGKELADLYRKRRKTENS